MRNTSIRSAVLVSTLMLLGAGCLAPASQPGPLDGIETAVNALGTAKELTAEERARQNRANDAGTNDISAAFIVTDGSEVPASVVRMGETIGCNDRVAFTRVYRETDSGDVAGDALASLFAVNDSNVEGLYNALQSSDLSVESVATVDGAAEVRISGTISSGGACDDPRIKAQVEATVSQYYPSYEIILNGSEAEWRCYGDQSGECE